MIAALSFAILGLVVLLNVAATMLLVRSTFSTRLQKLFQSVFIWAVPFVGAVIVIALAKETFHGGRSRRQPGSGDEWLAGTGPDSDGFGSRQEHHGGGDFGHGGDAGHGG